ncbi:MAG TPA: hypothetical protein VN035_03935 [Microbacterium sp.]|nr:hypothetical protein [Microbacterium sp.]
MLPIERIREIGADEAGITEENVRVARQALTREIARSARPDRVRRRRRAWAGLGIGGLVAGTAVTAIVVGSVLAPVEAPSASAAVFEQAAAGAEQSDQPLAPGEFRRFETSFSWNARWDADMAEQMRFNNDDPTDAEATLLVEDKTTTYVPADQDDDWVRSREPFVVVDGFGERRAEAEREWAEANAQSSLAGITRYPGGIAEGGGDGGTFEYRLDGADVYSDMPDDVPGVIAWFSDRYEGEGDSYDLGHYFIETISDVNVFNLASADVRSAMLRAFATLEDVEVVQVDSGLTTIRYERRNGDGRSAPVDITLDTERGYVIQVISWPYGVDDAAVDEGAHLWSSRTVAEITVVDVAP